MRELMRVRRAAGPSRDDARGAHATSGSHGARGTRNARAWIAGTLPIALLIGTFAPAAAVPSVSASAVAPPGPTEVLFHLQAASLTLYQLTYLGVTSVPTATGHADVLDFTATAADIVTMATTAPGNIPGSTIHTDGGPGRTVHVIGLRMHVLRQTGDAFGAVPIDIYPGAPVAQILRLVQGIPLPTPIVITDVHIDQYRLSADMIDVPGFTITEDV